MDGSFSSMIFSSYGRENNSQNPSSRFSLIGQGWGIGPFLCQSPAKGNYGISRIGLGYTRGSRLWCKHQVLSICLWSSSEEWFIHLKCLFFKWLCEYIHTHIL